MSPMSQLQGPSMMKGDFKNRSEDASHEAIKYQSANGSTDQDKAKIAARLTSAAIFAKPFKYHSSDLVPLKHAYDSLRKELSALIYCAKKYRDEIIQLDKARLDVRFFS